MSDIVKRSNNIIIDSAGCLPPTLECLIGVLSILKELIDMTQIEDVWNDRALIKLLLGLGVVGLEMSLMPGFASPVSAPDRWKGNIQRCGSSTRGFDSPVLRTFTIQIPLSF